MGEKQMEVKCFFIHFQAVLQIGKDEHPYQNTCNATDATQNQTWKPGYVFGFIVPDQQLVEHDKYKPGKEVQQPS